MKRYTILATTSDDIGNQQWLPYPVFHYSYEAAWQRADELNGEVVTAEEQGRCYPFVKYEVVEVDAALVGEWDERRKAAAT